MFRIIQLFCSTSHILYGIMTLTMSFYIEEFVRYGMSDFRLLIGLLQILCGIGLLNFNHHRINIISAGILTLLMLGAILVRLTIHDSFLKSSPAILYLLLNSYLFLKHNWQT